MSQSSWLLTVALINALLVGPAFGRGEWFGIGIPAQPLERAHQAFLEGDFQTLALSVKKVFQDAGSDDKTKRNALSLLEKAYAVRGGDAIPADWKLPEEVSRFYFSVRHNRTPDREDYGIKMGGNVPKKGMVKQLQVVKYNGEVVLDKEMKIGVWTEEQESPQVSEFEILTQHQPEPAAEGLYLFDIELENGKATHGWFVVSNLLSSETPTVRTPLPNQTFGTANPTMKWDDFISPEYQSYEQRGLWLSAFRVDPSHDDWKQEWDQYFENPTVTSVTIGSESGGHGVTALSNGKYQFFVAYREDRRFGDMILRRQSTAVTPFLVRAKN